MTTPPKPRPAEHDRQAKLAAALRDNLKKRKAQARARDEAGASDPTASSRPAAKKPNPEP